MSELRKVGQDAVKAHLPGESLWVIPEKYDGDLMIAKIDNHPVSHLHNYDYGDLATFEKIDGYWELKKDETLSGSPPEP